MTDPSPPTACVLVIGNEVLSGRTRDANLPFLAARLAGLGVRLMEARVIPDDPAAIIAVLNEVRARYSYVFTTGGIGPTHDDVTAEAVARAFGVALRRHPLAEALLRQHYRPEDLNAARLRMADIPEGAALIDNPVSKAPGFRLGNVFVMAGVPRIMQAMFDAVAPTLAGGPPLKARTLWAYVHEGDLAEDLRAIQARHPATEIGSYPFVRGGRLGTSIVVRGSEAKAVDAAAEAVRALMRARGGEPREDERIESELTAG
jgi:molybdenum cofactor synthesis domain-containing protein